MKQNSKFNTCIIDKISYNLTTSLTLFIPLFFICYYQVFFKNIFPNLDSAELIATNNYIYSNLKINGLLVTFSDLYFNRSYNGTINSILLFPFTILSQNDYQISFFLVKVFFTSGTSIMLFKIYQYFNVKTIDALIATSTIAISPMLIAERSFIEYSPFMFFTLVAFYSYINFTISKSFTSLIIFSFLLSLAFSCRPPEFLLISFLILTFLLLKKKFQHVDKYFFIGLLLFTFETMFHVNNIHTRTFFVYPNLIFIIINLIFSYFIYYKKPNNYILLSTFFVFISFLFILIIPFWNDTFSWIKMMSLTSTIPQRVNNSFSILEVIRVFSSRFSIVPFLIFFILNTIILKMNNLKRTRFSYFILIAIGIIFLTSKSLEPSYHTLFFIFLWGSELYYSILASRKLFYFFCIFVLFFNIKELHSIEGYEDSFYKNIKQNAYLLSSFLDKKNNSKIGLIPLDEKTLSIDYGVIQLEVQKYIPNTLIGHIRDLDHGTGLGTTSGWEQCLIQDYDYLLIGPYYQPLNTKQLSPISLTGIDIIKKNSSNFSEIKKFELLANNNQKYLFFLATSKISLTKFYSITKEATHFGPAVTSYIPIHIRSNKCNQYLDQLKKQN